MGVRVHGRRAMDTIEAGTIELPFFITGMSGKLGNRVYCTRNGKICSRRYVMPSNPRTGRQRECRSRFARAVSAWRGLNADARASWNRRARALNLSGYNLFMRETMSRTAGKGDQAPRHARVSRMQYRSVRVVKRAIAEYSARRLPLGDKVHRLPAPSRLCANRARGPGDNRYDQIENGLTIDSCSIVYFVQ